jgi:hypothetical protein
MTQLDTGWPEKMKGSCSRFHKPIKPFTCPECATIFSYNQAIGICKAYVEANYVRRDELPKGEE